MQSCDETSAVLLSLSLSLFKNKHLFTTSHKPQIFLLSHRFVWASGAQSAAVQLQHLTEVSTIALKLFIILPQGIGLGLQLPAWWRTACSSLSSRPKSSKSDSRYGCAVLYLLQVLNSYFKSSFFRFILCIFCVSRSLVSEWDTRRRSRWWKVSYLLWN